VSWIAYLISLAVFGLIVGAFARLALPGKDPLTLLQTMALALPGKDPMSLFGTMALGLAGSFIGGILLYVVTGGRYYGAGWFVSLVFATLILYFIRRRRGGGLTEPGLADRR
jgi:uncharacterized membrane protein YeaQ/YmgE (transglycosylase-associated protein family)